MHVYAEANFRCGSAGTIYLGFVEADSLADLELSGEDQLGQLAPILLTRATASTGSLCELRKMQLVCADSCLKHLSSPCVSLFIFQFT